MKKLETTYLIWDSSKCDYTMGNKVFTWDGVQRTELYSIDGFIYLNRRKQDRRKIK